MATASLGEAPDKNFLDDESADTLNPLAALCATETSLFDDDDGDDETQPTRRIRRPRDWGIPTFEQQCNGVNSFVLRPDYENNGDCGDDPTGVTIELEHRRHSTGSDIWDAALVLAHALSRPGIVAATAAKEDNAGDQFYIPNVLHSMAVLELGSGTGAVGLFAAKCLGAQHVVLTDLQDNLELLHRNRLANHIHDNSTLVALDWTNADLPSELNDGCSVDLILGSDLFLPFATHLLEPLARTIRDLLALSHRQRHNTAQNVVEDVSAPCFEPQALICYEERFDTTPFFEAASVYCLRVDFVESSLLHPKYQDPDYIKLLRIRLND